MDTKHTPTPTPWQRDNRSIRRIWLAGRTQRSRTQSIATFYGEDAEANAKHVIRCVNRYEEMLAALQACLPDLQLHAATHGPGPDQRYDRALAAVAKAAGSQA